MGFQTISLYSLDQDRSFPLTDGLAEASEPIFDAGGKYLFFLASTDAGPVKNWFDQSFTDMPLTLSAYLVTLQKSTPNPLLKESDEEPAEGSEKGKDETKSQQESSSKDQKDSSAPKKDEPKGPEKKGTGHIQGSRLQGHRKVDARGKDGNQADQASGHRSGRNLRAHRLTAA